MYLHAKENLWASLPFQWIPTCLNQYCNLFISTLQKFESQICSSAELDQRPLKFLCLWCLSAQKFHVAQIYRPNFKIQPEVDNCNTKRKIRLGNFGNNLLNSTTNNGKIAYRFTQEWTSHARKILLLTRVRLLRIDSAGESKASDNS